MPQPVTVTSSTTPSTGWISWYGGPVRAFYPCPEPGMLTDHPGIHVTRLPRSHTEPYSYCPRCVGCGTVAAGMPRLPDTARVDDGYDWISQLSGGWTALALWGRDGWDLGQWPYQVLAVCPPHCVDDARSFGLATYTEGDIEISAYPTRAALGEAISRYAHSVWRLVGNGPDDLPERFEDTPDAHQQPVDLHPPQP